MPFRLQPVRRLQLVRRHYRHQFWYHFDFTSLSGIIRGLLASNDAVPSTASSSTTANSSTLPSSSLVPSRLHFVVTTVTNAGTILTSLHRLIDDTNSGTISTSLHRLSDEVCDFALKSSPLRELECVMSYASPMPSSGESREPYEAEAGS